MKKKYIWLFIVSALFFCTILTSIIYGYTKNTRDYNVKQLGKSENNTEVIQTSTNNEIKVSPNARVFQKQYYKHCGHTIEDSFTVPEELINKTRGEIEKYYYGWTIESFTNKEIHLFRESFGICDEHYVVKDTNGNLSVYRKTDKGEDELYLCTEIITKYLPEEDYNKLENGINIIGKENLYSLLQDYE